MMTLYSSLFLVIVLHLVPSILAHKRLVFFAGPHKSASSSVETFFHNHASGYNDAPTSESLEGWIWPPIYGDLYDRNHAVARHEVFTLLVRRPDNATVQEILMNGIEKAWNEAKHGIIVGTAEFDRIGDTRSTHWDGLKAMKQVVDKLRISFEDVTVVLNYRTPRIEQWVSLWKHAGNDADYHKYLCDAQSSKSRFENLETAMNPLKLALIYREQGWKVAVIDMGGVEALEMDVAHAISCKVLEHTDCQDGWISEFNTTYHLNDAGDKEIHGLQDAEKQELEQLFRERDCHYELKLRRDDGFQVVYDDTIWQGCMYGPKKKKLYEHLSDTEFLFNAIKTQMGCAEDKVHMKDVLVGDYETMTSSTISQHSVNSDRVFESGPGDESNPSEAAMESLESLAEEPLVSRKSPSDSPITTSFFLMIAVMVSMYQLYLTHRTQQDGDDTPFSNRHQELRDIALEAPSSLASSQIDAEYGEREIETVIT
jgi:hypothetical protein